MANLYWAATFESPEGGRLIEFALYFNMKVGAGSELEGNTELNGIMRVGVAFQLV